MQSSVCVWIFKCIHFESSCRSHGGCAKHYQKPHERMYYETPSRFRKGDLEIFRFCLYLRIDNSVVQSLILRYFSKIIWYTSIFRVFRLHQVLCRLWIHSTSVYVYTHDICI